MKILVFSDSHGDLDSMIMAINQHENIDAVIHLGDGLEEFEKFQKLYNLSTYMVKGNNDFFTVNNYQSNMLITLENINILLTHGHIYNVKNGLTTLAQNAKNKGVSVVLYGHTHLQKQDEIMGVLLLNPGSISRFGFKSQYMIININNGHIVPEMYTLRVKR